MSINITPDLPESTTDLLPWESALLSGSHGEEVTPDSDRAERFRALREEAGDYPRALELLDVSRLRVDAYRKALADRPSQSTVDDLRATIERLAADLGTVRADLFAARNNPIKLDDPRLADEWVRAGEVATEEGFCGEYDRMCERFGIPGRERTWDVPVYARVNVTVQVTATSADSAREAVEREHVQTALAHRSGWAIDVDDFDVDEDEQASVAD
jgi:hypothetical protein